MPRRDCVYVEAPAAVTEEGARARQPPKTRTADSLKVGGPVGARVLVTPASDRLIESLVRVERLSLRRQRREDEPGREGRAGAGEGREHLEGRRRARARGERGRTEGKLGRPVAELVAGLRSVGGSEELLLAETGWRGEELTG